ncbi:MAG TPA: molybdopterin-dependent oxidoreductase [Burkholderiaceae bacterium]|nr:molybdopterin-dependent oxidoreductase [Burkholderiaceae bacterium]
MQRVAPAWRNWAGHLRAAWRGLLAAAIAVGLCAPWFAVAADAVAVVGDVRRSITIDVAALRAFPAPSQVSFRASREVDGQTPTASEVKGVRLLALLEQAGLSERDRFDWRKTIVVAIARDGYRVVFSWPELANTAGGAQVMVAYERDGAVLSEQEGPFAIHAPSDTRTGPRHVKWLQRIEVRVLRD